MTNIILIFATVLMVLQVPTILGIINFGNAYTNRRVATGIAFVVFAIYMALDMQFAATFWFINAVLSVVSLYTVRK